MVLPPRGYERESPPQPAPRALPRSQGTGPSRGAPPGARRAPSDFGGVTLLLVIVNVAILALMVVGGASLMSPTTAEVIPWGANHGPYTRHGEWWRLITACFVHGGLIHLGFNMYVLWDLGRLTERIYGSLGFALVYVVAGIGGSFASVMLNPMTTSVGASGAVFGVAGAFVAFLVRNHGRIDPAIASHLRRSLMTFIAFNLVIGFAVPGIDQAAHVGGLVTGFVTGALAAPRVTTSGFVRAYWAYPMVVATGVVLCVIVGLG